MFVIFGQQNSSFNQIKQLYVSYVYIEHAEKIKSDRIICLRVSTQANLENRVFKLMGLIEMRGYALEGCNLKNYLRYRLKILMFF